MFLNSLKAHVIAAFTLQMIDHGSESCELFPTAPVWAVIKLLLVNWRAKVLVQGCKSVEEAVAKIALVGVD